VVGVSRRRVNIHRVAEFARFCLALALSLM
jgi:hypothetical protein